MMDELSAISQYDIFLVGFVAYVAARVSAEISK
jgi:hypothetical protein